MICRLAMFLLIRGGEVKLKEDKKKQKRGGLKEELKSGEKNKPLEHLSVFFSQCLKWAQGKCSCQSNCLPLFYLIQLVILICEGIECVHVCLCARPYA